MAKKKYPSLKSTSGAGFSFEDKVAALLLAEMFSGIPSLGASFQAIQKLERQAIDWEPFGDLLLDIPTCKGTVIHCAVSVKSNRTLNSNGCDPEVCKGMWKTMKNTVFNAESDLLLLASAPLPLAVKDHVNSLCQQAKGLDSNRLDQKIVHGDVRKIYESFRNTNDTTINGLPGNLLSKLIHREFDFEESVSRSEKEAFGLCCDLLQSRGKASELWERLCKLAQDLRVSGGSMDRAGLSAELREQFDLKDDPSDTQAWEKIHIFSQDAMVEINDSLPGGIQLPRKDVTEALRKALSNSPSCHLLGNSGSGKSAIVKKYAAELESTGGEIVWIKAERWDSINSDLSHLLDVLVRCRKSSALLVVDALECLKSQMFNSLAKMVATLERIENSPWTIIFVCQALDWNRVSSHFLSYLGGSSILRNRVKCELLAKEDLELICNSSPTVKRLFQDLKLRKLLSTPKMLDVLLSGQIIEGLPIAGEPDLVDWWWAQQVRGANNISSQERVARDLAYHMANELCTELPLDYVAGAETAADILIRNRVLQRTQDGLLRFEHDLLADWSRVIFLKGLGQDKLKFLKEHFENPPWQRAVRILSQHYLDRVSDLSKWRNFIKISGAIEQESDKLDAETLQIIDVWLEGIIFSLEPRQILMELSDDLFANDGWLLRRMIRRLMIVGTIPDPVFQKRIAEVDTKLAEQIINRYRLPWWPVWSPTIDFLVSFPDQVTDMLPVELGEIAEMWARFEDYIKLEWPELAGIVMLNAEKELRREASGEFRHDKGSAYIGRGSQGRKTIYAGSLLAANQQPDRAIKLLSKAAGIIPWEDGDTEPDTQLSWLGEWEEPKSIFSRRSGVEHPPTSWPDGPIRKTSSDFFNAWFDSNASIRLFRLFPDAANKATLGFLLDWPKRTLSPREYHGIDKDHYGFSFLEDHDMYPPFYTKGPFLHYLRIEWEHAMDLIVKLINSATDRYYDWWYSNGPESLTFPTEYGEVSWFGNQQVYGWSRFHMNTVEVVGCALMAFEKWLEEQIDKKESIAKPIQFLYEQGRSLAFAGVLIALGKRHPELFLVELKPLLFVRELYMLDSHTVMENLGTSFWFHDGEVINNLRREWESMDGRQTHLHELAYKWMVESEDFRRTFNEVASTWRAQTDELPDNSEERLSLLRWAARFDWSNWKKFTLDDGRVGWQCELPDDLRDIEGENEFQQRQALMSIPYQCREWLEKRTILSHNQLNEIWEQLHHWTGIERASEQMGNEKKTILQDHRHARAALLAVLLSIGNDWLNNDASRRPWIEEEVKKLLSNPPEFFYCTFRDIHVDGEEFLARCVVQCWIHSPSDQNWRSHVAYFATADRYRTIKVLFEDAFKERSRLGDAYRDLEGFILAFSVVRRRANLEGFKPQPELIHKWSKKWISKFKRGCGPKWTDHWESIEVKEVFPPSDDSNQSYIISKKLRRRNFGLDVEILLAAFGGLPPLTEAKDSSERKHWMTIFREMLSVYLRTLPSEEGNDQEWEYENWEVDRKILGIIASRLFQCTSIEQRRLWEPILSLPPAAHHHISQFLGDVLMETIRVEPAKISELIPIWRAMVEFLFDSPLWTGTSNRYGHKVWKCLFFYDGWNRSVRDEDHAPLVAALHDLFARHASTLGHDAYGQSDFAAFVISDAGKQLLVDVFEWLEPNWQNAGSYFWKTVATQGHFKNMLQLAWQNHFNDIRQRPKALKAFKILTMNLAAQQDSIAIEIQKQIADGNYTP